MRLDNQAVFMLYSVIVFGENGYRQKCGLTHLKYKETDHHEKELSPALSRIRAVWLG